MTNNWKDFYSGKIKIYPSGQGDVLIEDVVYFYVFHSQGVDCKAHYVGPCKKTPFY